MCPPGRGSTACAGCNLTLSQCSGPSGYTSYMYGYNRLAKTVRARSNWGVAGLPYHLWQKFLLKSVYPNNLQLFFKVQLPRIAKKKYIIIVSWRVNAQCTMHQTFPTFANKMQIYIFLPESQSTMQWLNFHEIATADGLVYFWLQHNVIQGLWTIAHAQM
jgi:hypothetical protein